MFFNFSEKELNNMVYILCPICPIRTTPRCWTDNNIWSNYLQRRYGIVIHVTTLQICGRRSKLLQNDDICGAHVKTNRLGVS